MAQRNRTSLPRCFRLLLLLLLCVLILGIGVTSARAIGQELSGTITYSGTRVVVSDSQPVIIFLAAFDPNVDIVDVAHVPVSGGAFVLHAPAPGNYYLVYAVDVHDYGDAFSVGAPFEVYNDRFAFSYPAPFPADPIFVPRGGVSLAFDDTGVISGIAGTTTYTGQFPQGDIPCICVEAFTDPLHTQADADEWCCGNDGRTGRYELNRLQNPGTPYYLRVFVDLNDNRQLDAGEPVGTCSNPVVAGPDQTDVAITFGDAGAATCIVPSPPTPTAPPTATPTSTPAPSCPGDCDGLDGVTVNEIIILVNIALGSANNSACPHGIPTGATVDISLIIQAVNNALSGCPGR